MPTDKDRERKIAYVWFCLGYENGKGVRITCEDNLQKLFAELAGEIRRDDVSKEQD